MTDFNFAPELEEFFKNTAYGTPDNITRDGCIALALLDNRLCEQNNIENGTLWNYWRHKYPVTDIGKNSSNFENYDAEKHGDINFSRFNFGEYVDFSGAIFPVFADFSGAIFAKNANFSGVTFREQAYFSGATLTGQAYFSGTTFTERADFSGATFTGRADFSGATFTESASFSEKTLIDANFSTAIFTKEVDFINVTFTGWTDFRGAEFKDKAVFIDVKCIGEVDFSSAKFKDKADFERATFTKEADFIGTKFTGKTDFNGAKFTGKADFSGATFKTSLYLDNCTFEKLPPLFFDATLCENFTVLKCNFDAIPADDIAKRAYGKIKEHYAKIKNTQGELEFAVYELEQERLLEKRQPNRFFFNCYKLTADYGQSIWKPLFCYLLSFVLFKAIILIYDADLIHFDTAINWYTVLDVCKISFDGFMPSVTSKPLELVSIPLSRQAGSWLTVLYAIQKFFSIIGWFLIALAMKNLFKIRSGG
jgi:uncharacterized protein YjbI with pentapeptide repeats